MFRSLLMLSLGLMLVSLVSLGYAQSGVQVITGVVMPSVLVSPEGKVINSSVPYKVYTHQAGQVRITTLVDQTP